MSMISAREPEFEPAESSLAVLHAGGGHVIVCGLSNLGLRIAEQLHEAAVPCVIVDDGGAEAAWKQIKRWNIPVVRESSTSIASLMQAGIMQAGAVIAAHDEDLTNLETALLVTDLEERESEVHVVVAPRQCPARRAAQYRAAGSRRAFAAGKGRIQLRRRLRAVLPRACLRLRGAAYVGRRYPDQERGSLDDPPSLR